MSKNRLIMLVVLTMIAFAGNSILNRIALLETAIDPASFTVIRLVSGAVMLSVMVWLQQQREVTKSTEANANWIAAFSTRRAWIMALALFVYAAGFSYAYVSLSAAVGALILFAAVQFTMIGYGFSQGERFTHWQWLGFMMAFGGLIILMMPGVSMPSVDGALLMLLAGIAWGIYSIMGKGAESPLLVTRTNFVLSVPLVIGLSLVMKAHASVDLSGASYAVLSGAVASGVGYALWYKVLPYLPSTTAATIQLSVPVIAALGGVAILGEAISLRLVLVSLGILGGIALVIQNKQV
ncbi:EamA/RhaT family transporter [Photobacterium sanctipauli]|uniref:EamA/RhaT family transporter n=1 Tax=Photobacterium sanctipauli TaxID=1342794 RepID=A0A2T3NWG0_9GAMM|nr:DMT family transporter [Photobacterium sanctipauli]PSW20623.1 EamA/RhaT family transporter [Photobacterium sanctipauli]